MRLPYPPDMWRPCVSEMCLFCFCNAWVCFSTWPRVAPWSSESPGPRLKLSFPYPTPRNLILKVWSGVQESAAGAGGGTMCPAGSPPPPRCVGKRTKLTRLVRYPALNTVCWSIILAVSWRFLCQGTPGLRASPAGETPHPQTHLLPPWGSLK